MASLKRNALCVERPDGKTLRVLDVDILEPHDSRFGELRL
jgi:hypothetical protein